MRRTHGYSAKGQRCYGEHDWGAKGRTNVIGALFQKTLIAVTLFNCNIDADVFFSWTKNCLLKSLPPKSVVVMDNATFHKRKDIENIIKMSGHTLEYLPPYSPDLNLIEHHWAMKKAQRKKHKCSINNLFSGELESKAQ